MSFMERGLKKIKFQIQSVVLPFMLCVLLSLYHHIHNEEQTVWQHILPNKRILHAAWSVHSANVLPSLTGWSKSSETTNMRGRPMDRDRKGWRGGVVAAAVSWTCEDFSNVNSDDTFSVVVKPSTGIFLSRRCLSWCTGVSTKKWPEVLST